MILFKNCNIYKFYSLLDAMDVEIDQILSDIINNYQTNTSNSLADNNNNNNNNNKNKEMETLEGYFNYYNMRMCSYI